MIIYFDPSTGKYYWDKECTSEIKGAPDILGKKDGNIIYGNGDTDYVIEEVKRVAMAIPIYYNEADGNYYSDPDCKNRIPNTSGFPKNPKEGDKIHAEGDSFYVVHRVNVNKYNYTRRSNSSSVQDIYYDDVTNSFYYDSELRNKVERILELDMYLFFMIDGYQLISKEKE